MAVTMDKLFSTIADTASVRSSTANSMLSGGMNLYQKGRYKEAIAAFKQATAYQPDLLAAYNLMGQAYTQLNDSKGAIAAYKISIKLDKTQGNIHMAMGNIYMADQNYTEAEKSLKEAAKADPTSALPPYTLGLVYKQTGRESEAEAMFKKTIQLSPKDGNPYYALGALYNQQGRYDEAVTQLQQALEHKSNFALANSELGKAYLALGQRDGAQEQLDILQGLDTSLYKDLNSKMDQPKILMMDSGNSTFNNALGAFGSGSSMIALDPSFVQPGASKDFTMQFMFDREMDVSSVINVTNWSITKARGGTAGLYDNGLYRPTDTRIPLLPKNVVYDPTTRKATVSFSLTQNDMADGTIDPSHVIFKFMGKDIDGKTMDPTADEYNYFADVF